VSGIKSIMLACTHQSQLSLQNLYARSSRMICFARLSHGLGVCLSVRPSHCCTVSKRCKLISQNLHCGLPQRLVYRDEISCPGWGGSPRPTQRALIGRYSVDSTCSVYLDVTWRKVSKVKFESTSKRQPYFLVDSNFKFKVFSTSYKAIDKR